MHYYVTFAFSMKFTEPAMVERNYLCLVFFDFFRLLCLVFFLDFFDLDRLLLLGEDDDVVVVEECRWCFFLLDLDLDFLPSLEGDRSLFSHLASI